jgi:hypothetical protein
LGLKRSWLQKTERAKQPEQGANSDEWAAAFHFSAFTRKTAF